MSKTLITIIEAKIVNTENNKPTKIPKKDSTEFSRFCFNICAAHSKKNTEGEWENKLISYKCTIWSEAIADKFLKNFEPNKKNYITLLNANLSDLQLVQTSQVSNQGNEYTLTSYTNYNLNVNDFVITCKEIDENKEVGKKEKIIEHDDAPIVDNLDDEIPF